MIEMIGGKKTFAVIRAVYDHRNSPEEFIRELDFVLEKNVNVVIIEPDDLGEVTWRWIRTGNWLHKTAVLSGFAAVFGTCLFIYSEGKNAFATSSFSIPSGISPRLLPSIFCGVISVASAGLYALFWQWDPCSKYQVASSIHSLPPRIAAAAMNVDGSPNASPVSYSASSPSPSTVGRIMSSEVGEYGPILQNGAIHGNVKHYHSHKVSCKCPECDQGGPPIRPVVLIRRDDFYRKLMHNSVSFTALIVVGFTILRLRPNRIFS